jgi:hypothetical protein
LLVLGLSTLWLLSILVSLVRLGALWGVERSSYSSCWKIDISLRLELAESDQDWGWSGQVYVALLPLIELVNSMWVGTVMSLCIVGSRDGGKELIIPGRRLLMRRRGQRKCFLVDRRDADFRIVSAVVLAGDALAFLLAEVTAFQVPGS